MTDSPRRPPWAAAIFVAALVLACGKNPPPDHIADLVLQHGAVYTVAPGQPWAEAVVVKGGRLVYVGPDSGANAWIGEATRVIDVEGRMVLPGFFDSHVHLAVGGIDMTECELAADSTPSLIAAHVARCAAEHPEQLWVRGSNWQLPVFPKGNPQKSLLDSLIPDRPAIFDAADGHSAWVNSRALALAHVTRHTRDPRNGRIERDPGTGEPSGTLRESAMDLVARLLPPYTPADYVEGLRLGMAEANRLGITSIQEADAHDSMLAAYSELDHAGKLTVRVTAALHVDEDKDESQVAALASLRERYRGPLLHPTSAKIFADGVIESRTAALLQPYLDHGSDRGQPNWSPKALNRMVGALDHAKFQIHVHAIGDRAIRITLDAFAWAQSHNGVRDSRHIIAHLELIDPADIPRFKALGVIADFQPVWAYPDDYVTDLTIPVLGPARSRWLYPIGSVVKTGATVASGSDWDVSSLNPLEAMQVAVTRRDPAADPGAAWIPEEVVDLPTIIAAYTINGAYANHEEAETGSLEVGKAADLVVLDRNLLRIPVTQIHEARVLLTLLEGREVYRAPDFAH